MRDRWLRWRAVLDSQFEVAVLVLIIVVVLGGWVTYGAHVEPGTTTEERTVSSWATTGSYTHSATVTEPNPVYEVGTELRDRSVYLVAASPVLHGHFVFSYNATDSGNLDVTVVKRAVLQAVDEQREERVVVWEQSRNLASRTRIGVTAGSAVSVPFSLDINRSQNRTERIVEQLDNPPGEVQLLVVTTVDLSGTINGQSINRTEEYVMPIRFTQNSYRVNATAVTIRGEQTETVEMPRNSGTYSEIGGPLLSIIGVLGLAAMAVARTREELALTDTERDLLRFRAERAEFDEWITAIDLPEAALDLPRANAKSLADLVDFAIDTNCSVVEAADGDAFYVRYDGVLFVYERPDESGEPPESRDDSAD